MTFYRYFMSLRGRNSSLIGEMGNAGQTPVYFDMMSNATITMTGLKRIASSQQETRSSASQLCSSAWQM